ncbi:hypothetical protein AB0D49_14585 [Streptomyces sp. NPDC048290]|uniref:hypothetical protein n=1 Tax=Streptomyces sp. NPDC048290 TaxID=3155811 RepID=UPI003438BA4F
MPGILVAPSPSVSAVGLREGVEIFGGPEPGEPVRAEVQVRMCLSFAEILGLLLYTPGLSLLFEELEDDEAIADSLQFAVIDTNVRTLEINGERAMVEYRNARAGRCRSALFVQMLAGAVTRVFGVTAA